MEQRRPSADRALQTGGVLARRKVGGFTYPRGAYPEENVPQAEGYDAKYIKDEGLFYYQVILSHEKILTLFAALTELLPSKGHLVVKIHSEDFYHDHDTYLSDDLIEKEQLIEWMNHWRDVVVDDGFFGVGMYSAGGSREVFLDEHKTIHIYHDDPDFVEETLAALNIPFTFELGFFWDQPHFHEALPVEEQGSDYLTAFEDLADSYNLFLDEDDDENLNPTGDPIGVTCWKVDIRGYSPINESEGKALGYYTTCYVNGESRRDVIDLLEEQLGREGEQVDLVLQMARVPHELLRAEMRKRNEHPDEPGVWFQADRVFFDWSHS
jgi:hypothetical protein